MFLSNDGRQNILSVPTSNLLVGMCKKDIFTFHLIIQNYDANDWVSLNYFLIISLS